MPHTWLHGQGRGASAEADRDHGRRLRATVVPGAVAVDAVGEVNGGVLLSHLPQTGLACAARAVGEAIRMFAEDIGPA